MSDSTKQHLARRLKLELPQFTGDLQRFRHSLFRTVIYTPGVQYLMQEASAYWLIDAIAGHLASPEFHAAVKQDSRIQDLHFWKLTVNEDDSALLRATVDRGERAFIRQSIPFTDFPLPSIDIWVGFDGQHYTVYLPSEH